MPSLEIRITRPAITKTSKAGTPYKVQTGTVQLFDRDGNVEEVPRRVEFMTDVEYAPGVYELDIRSFVIGQYDKLELGRMRLAPKEKPGTGGAAASK